MSERNLSRRQFFAAASAGAAAVALGSRGTQAIGAEAIGGQAGTEVWVLKGENNAALMKAGLKVMLENGGFGKGAQTMALKVNAAWTRKPEEGANTDPTLVEEFIKGVKAAGIRKVVVPEHPCNAARTAFTRSGLQDAVERAGSEMVDLKSNRQDFKEVAIPGGRNLKQAKVAGQFIDADVVVNMPVAKHHGGAVLTMAMKNWMGVVEDRRFWHKNNLHQCIADFATFMKPRWTVIDCTRCMLDSGPQGPAREMVHPHEIIISRDQVAADAVASKHFPKAQGKVKYLEIAAEMGVGETDESRMNIHRVSV